MSAPSSSFEMDSLDEKAVPLSTDTLLLKDTADSDLLKEVQVGNLSLATVTIPFVWAASDEDSPLALGLQYTTEAAEITKTLSEVILSLKNAATGSPIVVDVRKETGVNTNVFATIFSTPPLIDVNEFTSQTSASIPVFSDTTWEVQRRLQIVITANDINFATTGLKVTLV